MTLAVYIAFLISTGKSTAYLADVLADFAEIEAFVSYAGLGPYVISEAVIAEIRAGRKISAIKIVRTDHPRVDGRVVGLKEAKDIVDAYISAHPEQYNVAPRPYPY